MNGQTSTKHSPGCRRAWRHYDATCPRCRELAQGLPARKAWEQQRRETPARPQPTLDGANLTQALRDNTERFMTDAVVYDEFQKFNRTLWDTIEAKGLNAEVNARLRGDL